MKVPALTALHLQVGRAQRMKKDYAGALENYAKIPAGDPNAEKAKVEIGMTNLEKGDLPAADAALSEAAQNLNAGKEVFYNLGEVKFAKGETDEAMKWYQRAVDVDANWAKPYFKLGLGKLQKADMPGAIEMMEKVIAVEPAWAKRRRPRRSSNSSRRARVGGTPQTGGSSRGRRFVVYGSAWPGHLHRAGCAATAASPASAPTRCTLAGSPPGPATTRWPSRLRNAEGAAPSLACTSSS